MKICYEKVPQELAKLRQWVLWDCITRDGKATKVPVQSNGMAAKSNDPATWTTFTQAAAAFETGKFSGGIGFMFAADDPFCGIDLDGCRDPQTGKVADWAKEIIIKFGSYAEVSPSETGVKIFCRADSPFESGKKKQLPSAKVCDKEPAIEIYDRLRYFAVTGAALKGCTSIKECREALVWLKASYWPDQPLTAPPNFHSPDAVTDRARKYMAKLPASVSGSGGHNAAFHAACVLVLGFECDENLALDLMREFNQRCAPAWSDRELQHKVRQALKQPGPRGYLRNASPANWNFVNVPNYQAPAPTPEPKETTLADAARKYLESVRAGGSNLVSICLPELDYALGGGVALGEMVVFSARPSHGKSMAALQAVHNWTAEGMPCAIVSEEMSSLMLGRRTLQFITPLHEEHWQGCADDLEKEIAAYEQTRANCTILENCGSAQAAVEGIERMVSEKGVKCAVIDYAQLLRGQGKTRYEQTTNTSLMLRQLATANSIVLLVLCQMSREIEKRNGVFRPTMADIKDTGQFEQDADAIVFLCWPHRNDKDEPIENYEFHIAKNRNRAINQPCVKCRFTPSRQLIQESIAYDPAEAVWEQTQRRAP